MYEKEENGRVLEEQRDGDGLQSRRESRTEVGFLSSRIYCQS